MPLYPAGFKSVQPRYQSFAPALSAVKYHVFLLAGQSNVVGKATDFDYAGADAPEPRADQWNHTTSSIVAAVEPLLHPDPNVQQGPWGAFARQYASRLGPGERILLVPAARGGTGFVLPDDNGTGYHWDRTLADDQFNLALRAKDRMDAALTRVGAGNVVRVGVFWNQGGTDANAGTSGSAYQTKHDDFVNWIKGLYSAPVVIGQMRPDTALLSTSRKQINQVHVSAATRLTNTRFVYGPRGASNYLVADSAHYSALGNRRHGFAYAEAMWGMFQSPTGALNTLDSMGVWSLRKLRSQVAVPCVRVRRSLDNVEADIGYSGDALDQAALLAHVGSGSGFVTTWYDQSVYGYHLVQATASRQPRLVNAGVVETIGTRPAVVFDGTDDFLGRDSPGYSEPRGVVDTVFPGTSMFLTVQAATPGGTVRVVGESSDTSNTGANNYQMVRNSSANWNVQMTNQAGTSIVASTLGSVFDNTARVLSFVDTGTTFSTWRAGVLNHNAVAATPNGTLSTQNFGVGAWMIPTPSSFFAGKVSDLVLSRTTVDATTRAAVEAILTP